jgi:serine protease Do
MQEFFRRFFGQPLPGAPRQPGPRASLGQELQQPYRRPTEPRTYAGRDALRRV